MKNISFVLTVLLFSISCNKKNVKINRGRSTSKSAPVAVIIDTASAFNDNKVKEFQQNVIDNGDPDSFVKLIIHYQDKSNYKELNKYALIMADKYSNGDGYNMVFESTIASNNNNRYSDISDFAKINAKAKREALKYLEKGASLNDINCMSMLENIYRNGIGVEKDILKANKLSENIQKL